MGAILRRFLNGPAVVACASCQTHLSTPDELVSKNYQGLTGRAYLYRKVTNVYEGEPEDRLMTTGTHTVADIHCTFCTVQLGWRYIKAYEESQQFKEGKYILERKLINSIRNIDTDSDEIAEAESDISSLEVGLGVAELSTARFGYMRAL